MPRKSYILYFDYKMPLGICQVFYFTFSYFSAVYSSAGLRIYCAGRTNIHYGQAGRRTAIPSAGSLPQSGCPGCYRGFVITESASRLCRTLLFPSPPILIEELFKFLQLLLRFRAEILRNLNLHCDIMIPIYTGVFHGNDSFSLQPDFTS